MEGLRPGQEPLWVQGPGLSLGEAPSLGEQPGSRTVAWLELLLPQPRATATPLGPSSLLAPRSRVGACGMREGAPASELIRSHCFGSPALHDAFQTPGAQSGTCHSV